MDLSNLKLTPESGEDPVVFRIDWGFLAIINLLSHYEFESVLDIGSGLGEHARLFRHFGKKVYSIDIADEADYVGDFLDVKLDRTFDVVWCSHVLEHQRNVGRFLDKIYDDCLDDGGILAIALPVHPRDRMVAGHLTSWNAGLLCYNLIYAGFDCSKAKFIQAYDLNLIVRKAAATGSEIRANSVVSNSNEGTGGDHFSFVKRYFPFEVHEGAHGEPSIVGWDAENHLPFKDGIAPVSFINKNLFGGQALTLRAGESFTIGRK